MEQKHQTLWQVWHFKIAFWLPAFTAAMLASFVYFTEAHAFQLCGTSKCFGTFLELYALPIRVWAIAIPISALSATTHRSDQMKRQMDLQVQQNSFANYYTHINEFERHAFRECENEKERRALSSKIDVRRLHRLLFENEENDGALLLRPDFIHIVKCLGKETRAIIAALEHTPPARGEINAEILMPFLRQNYHSELEALDEAQHIIGNLSGRALDKRKATVGSYLRFSESRCLMLAEVLTFDTSVDAEKCIETLHETAARMSKCEDILTPILKENYIDFCRLAGVSTIP